MRSESYNLFDADIYDLESRNSQTRCYGELVKVGVKHEGGGWGMKLGGRSVNNGVLGGV